MPRKMKKFPVIHKSKLARILQKMLEKDILLRYNYNAYWSKDVISNFQDKYSISDAELVFIMQELE
jgi:hypothetical protein